MKKLEYTKSASRLTVLFFLLLALACSKEAEELSLTRQFSPAKFSNRNGETDVTLAWDPSLFTLPGEVTYQVEVSDNASDFSNPAFTTTTGDVTIKITDEKLVIKKDYYARVRALGNEETGTAESNWLMSSAFRILGEQFLLDVASANVIDEAVRLYWRPNPNLTKITVTSTGGAAIEVTLSDADKAANMKQIDNLAAGTNYTAEIFEGVKSKGIKTFATKAGLPSSINVVDLRGISTTQNPNILTQTLDAAPSGSVILLQRGESYVITANYAIARTVTIQSGLDFGTALATIKFNSSTNGAVGFTIPNPGATTIDSLVFKDLILKGTRGVNGSLSYATDQVFNSGGAGGTATIGRIKLENCIVKAFRGVVRAQAGTTQIANYIVNNCVMDSIADFAVATAANTSSIANIKITNTTVYKARRLIVHTVAGNSSLIIENCTFNEVPAGAGAATDRMIDYNAQNTSITIKNCIFGKTWTESGTTLAGILRAAASAVSSASVTNTYTTSDFINTPAPLPSVSGYNGTSVSLFNDPFNGNFRFKDNNFIGKSTAGDPRWR
jgi:Domain of unknown function (DUF5123)/SusE outer membrane protein